ncbi:hypothetical protein WN48_03541 [Eufriesea mexicana]|uniref:Uncharacterized protein n=1 Tax=Eufriesea mexicana TaxID=516756 RepID=A0A310S7C7_9HYME|nr:hypothetical protein WN48_03541 [Eufriesea mexicana]
MAVGRSMRNVCSGHHAQTGREYHDSPHTENHGTGGDTPVALLRGIESDEPPYKFTLAFRHSSTNVCHVNLA